MTRTSITDVELYHSAVSAALDDEDAFARFKRLPGIQGAVERLSPARGAEYRAMVLRQTPGLLELLDQFRENDILGSPVTSEYPEGHLSPTTWRYIKVLSDLQTLFGSLEGWDVTEIGVGYGGQCKVISDLWAVSSYTMYDLDPVMNLARKYLARLGCPASARLQLADFRRLGADALRTYDLVISNWALSECTREVQGLYIAHVLRRSRRGYLTCNQISGMNDVDSYGKDEFLGLLGFPTELMPEGLRIDAPEGLQNFIVYWKEQPLLEAARR